MLFMNNDLLIWMVFAHVAFLLIPGLMILTYQWMHEEKTYVYHRRAPRRLYITKGDQGLHP